MNLDQWEYHPSRLPADKIERQRFLNELEQKFYDDLAARPDVRQWLQGWREESQDQFLKKQAAEKRQMVEYFETRFDFLKYERPALPFESDTRRCLSAILQKKWFNLRLRWGAGLVALPGVQHSCEFDLWEGSMEDCPFVDPPTPAEVAAMQDFLLTEEGVSFVARRCWPEDFMELLTTIRRRAGLLTEEEEEEAGEAYPAWYAYYDERFGTGELLHLPDHRRELEEHYEKLGAQLLEENKKATVAEPQPAAPPYTPPPPRLYYYSAEREYVGLFEDECFRELFARKWKRIDEWEEANKAYDTSDHLEYLEQCTDPAPMPAGTNWRAAIFECMVQSKARQIAADLDVLYQEYSLSRELGLKAGKTLESWQQRIVDERREMVLEGRASLGEPRDFNF